MKALAFLFLLSRVRTEEVATPASLLRPRNYNHHPQEAAQFLQRFKNLEPTEQGPVLFPNDAPSPPRPPLIVTSRPLIESIARSELNNSIAEPSHNLLSYKPFLARVKDYRPYTYNILSTPVPLYDFGSQVPYARVLKKARVNGFGRDNRYNDDEERAILPPIYKALSDHAKNKVLKVQQQIPTYDYQLKEDYTRPKQSNDVGDYDSNPDQTENANYAFSYTVKDHKTGDDFSHSQHSKGSATNGEYRVRLPDGRMQIVSYTADENGYQADVRYDDEDKTIGNSVIEPSNNYQTNYNNQNNYKTNLNAKTNINEYGGINNDYANRDYSNNDKNYNNHRNDYKDYTLHKDYKDYTQQKDYNVNENPKTKDDYYNPYSDISEEYYNDYSTEYGANYRPHTSKFSSFNNAGNFNSKEKIGDVNDFKTSNIAVSTVKPTYDELKDLLVTKNVYNTQQNYNQSPVEINVPSTTFNYDATTERVVVITKPNLYTNIRGVTISKDPINYTPDPINVTPVPINYSPLNSFIVTSTPRNYLLSTINSIKNKVSLTTKPVLSNNFINKINKYLSFT